jgi:hypothetical protein
MAPTICFGIIESAPTQSQPFRPWLTHQGRRLRDLSGSQIRPLFVASERRTSHDPKHANRHRPSDVYSGIGRLRRARVATGAVASVPTSHPAQSAAAPKPGALHPYSQLEHRRSWRPAERELDRLERWDGGLDRAFQRGARALSLRFELVQVYQRRHLRDIHAHCADSGGPVRVSILSRRCLCCGGSQPADGPCKWITVSRKRRRTERDGDARGDTYAPGRPSSRASHAFAVRQSRFAVDGETLRTCAVSSMVSPPNARSSTILASSGSTFCRRSSA